jgi:glycosyltransferase involved in cell wall biosynthesis
MAIKAIIIAPFWRQAGHVGNYRIERFIRWFSSAGVEILLVRAGSKDQEQQESWGLELTIRDPIGLYRDSEPSGEPPTPRKPNYLRRQLALWLFNPDVGVIWANHVAKHPKVLQHAAGAEWVLSSSRPESVHVASWRLAKKLKSKLVIDMRDGWLDEPLEPLLMTSSIRRFVEGRLEKNILAAADQIFVTSAVWRDLLVSRGVTGAEKVEVITNAYPAFDFSKALAEPCQHKTAAKQFDLLHTGRFRASRATQDPALLLEPLRVCLAERELKGQIHLLGQLDAQEQLEIEHYVEPMSAIGWPIHCYPAVSRDQAMTRIAQADGLLLLCAAQAAIPSKIFEYIPSKKPLLIVAKEDAAVWGVGRNIKQASLLDYTRPETWQSAIDVFLEMLVNTEHESNCPEIYSDDYLGNVFLSCLNLPCVKDSII